MRLVREHSNPCMSHNRDLTHLQGGLWLLSITFVKGLWLAEFRQVKVCEAGNLRCRANLPSRCSFSGEVMGSNASAGLCCVTNCLQ